MSYLHKALGIVPVASLGLFNHKLLPRECKIMGLEDRWKKPMKWYLNQGQSNATFP